MYFMEKTNFLDVHPDKGNMAGDSLTLEMNRLRTFKTKISRSKHALGDPHHKCTEYTSERSYNNCTNDELLGRYEEALGCVHPVLGKVFSTDPKIMCNRMFNISKDKAAEVEKLFQDIFHHNLKFSCTTPCTTTKYIPQDSFRTCHMIIRQC